MSNLTGIRKDYLQADSFRMILKEAVAFRPEHSPFNPLSGEAVSDQVELWKAKSAEQRGFDLAFRSITGISPGDLE